MLRLRTFDVNSAQASGSRLSAPRRRHELGDPLSHHRDAHWWPGKAVQLSPTVKDIDWFGEGINMNVSRDQVRSAPAWDPLALADEARGDELHRHFDWPGYCRPSEG
jgi:hypothetical protein